MAYVYENDVIVPVIYAFRPNNPMLTVVVTFREDDFSKINIEEEMLTRVQATTWNILLFYMNNRWISKRILNVHLNDTHQDLRI